MRSLSRRGHALVLGCVAVLGSALPLRAQEPPDLILHHARVWTGDEDRPWAEAVAMRGARIVAVGTDAEVLQFRGQRTQVRDLEGRFVSPGFIDNHTHFNRAGELLLGVNLLEVSDAEGLVEKVRETALRLPEGAWMVGGMWGAYEQWAVSSTGREEHRPAAAAAFRPDRSLIDPVSPRTPALLWNWDRSQILANQAALTAAGADCSWDGVECADGRPTGRLSQAAAERVRAAIPAKTMDQRLAEARMALADLAQFGVTTFFDITPPEQVEVYHRLRQQGDLTARVNMRMVLDTWDEMRDAGITEGFGDDWIRYQGLKGFMDGIMGSSQARFYEPYLTTGVRGTWRDATNTGYVTDHGSGYAPDGNMRALVFGADSAGFNPRVHAIGDEAVDAILDIFEEVQRVNGPREGRRFAIIHNQVIRGPRPRSARPAWESSPRCNRTTPSTTCGGWRSVSESGAGGRMPSAPSTRPACSCRSGPTGPARTRRGTRWTRCRACMPRSPGRRWTGPRPGGGSPKRRSTWRRPCGPTPSTTHGWG